jgi:hypothetical protein
MGCCTSTDSSAPLNSKNTSTSSAVKESAGKKEDKIELAFKVKRANIFTEGVDLGREAYVQKRIPKTEKMLKIISESPLVPCRSNSDRNAIFSFLQ